MRKLFFLNGKTAAFKLSLELKTIISPLKIRILQSFKYCVYLLVSVYPKIFLEQKKSFLHFWSLQSNFISILKSLLRFQKSQFSLEECQICLEKCPI